MSFNQKREEDNKLTTKEISRLIDWLKSKGFGLNEIEDCIDTISKEKGE